MKTTTETKELWKCPKCGRQFARKGQSHSCRSYALEQHFKGKETGKLLYESFIKAVETPLGALKIESLECCIHLVSTVTFAAVKIYKNKIQVEFATDHPLESERFTKAEQLSAHRFLYFVDIMKEVDLDTQLIQWVVEAYDNSKGA